MMTMTIILMMTMIIVIKKLYSTLSLLGNHMRFTYNDDYDDGDDVDDKKEEEQKEKEEEGPEKRRS